MAERFQMQEKIFERTQKRIQMENDFASAYLVQSQESERLLILYGKRNVTFQKLR